MRGVYKYLVASLSVIAVFLFSLLVLFRSSASATVDALFFTGAITASVGTLAVLTVCGEFTSLGYILSHGVRMLLPGTGYKHETLYDYQKRKREGRGKPPYYIILFGLSFVFASAVFLLI